MEYKGVDRTTELALTPDMIKHLALEAEFREPEWELPQAEFSSPVGINP